MIDYTWEKNHPFDFISIIILEVGLGTQDNESDGGHMSKLYYKKFNKPATIDIGKIWFE